MFIFIDESGSFVFSDKSDSWCNVAAYVVPEATRRQAESALGHVKRRYGVPYTGEVKLKTISEPDLLSFLKTLSALNGTLFASAVDMGCESVDAIAQHQASQVGSILANLPKMIHDEGRELIEDLAARVERLSPQLYIQMVAQIDLIDQVYRASTLYYAQRKPETLGAFRWRIDEKNASRPVFEETLRHMAPPLLQAKAMREPGVFVEGLDYSHFDRAFRYRPEEIPTYLAEETGSEIKQASNLGKILRDFAFMRSHDSLGLQIADLLSSAIGRVLRRGFQDNLAVARALAALMVQRAYGQPPLHLISLSGSSVVSPSAEPIAHMMLASARPMIR